MTFVSPRKSKRIALKPIKEKSLSFKSEDDGKMLESKLTRFAKKIQKVHEIQKFSERIKKKKGTQLQKKKKEKGMKKELEIECFKCGRKTHYTFECPSKKKNKKVIQDKLLRVTPSLIKQMKNESNECDECTNFIAFAANACQ